MGDIITYAIFLKVFLKLNDSSRDTKGPGTTLMASLTYLYILMKQLSFGAFWYLDLPMLGLTTLFLYGAHRDEDGGLPNWTLALICFAAIMIGGIEITQPTAAPSEGESSLTEQTSSVLGGDGTDSAPGTNPAESALKDIGGIQGNSEPEGEGDEGQIHNVLQQARDQFRRSDARRPTGK